MSLTNILIILATALSPLIAVQVSQYLSNQRDARDRKVWIFKTLMATRASSLSPRHVEALNCIELEFSPQNKKEKPVLDLWAELLTHLSNDQISADVWVEKRRDLLIELLCAMGTTMGYGFNKAQIKNGVYAPVAHGRIETENEEVRQLVLEVLKGSRSLPLRVTEFPPADLPPNG
jgi:hypothetical protein